MKLKKVYIIFYFLLIGMSSTAYAQDEPTGPPTLEEQFRSMKSASNSYQEYKVVKETLLDQFYSNVRDSLSTIRQDILEAQNKISAQQQEITRLQDELEEQQLAVEDSQYDIEHIEFLGIDVQKATYSTIVWSIIGILLIILAIAIYKYKSSNKVAVKKKNEYETLDTEFNEFKIRAREKETRLMRDLQTERNAVEELNQRLSSSQKSK
ncbi:hypothetical protein [Nafulsella turpanensis]|uniref:hypothetical protein n=1 Tax=Nafulsella turpanensis TaxID=1265690 RepID=UPI00034776AA|nr:hypothetical protein [Nafulsella turpanensis]